MKRIAKKYSETSFELPFDKTFYLILPYSLYYKKVLCLFLRLFGASYIREGLVFERVLYLYIRNFDTKFILNNDPQHLVGN